MVSFHFKLVYNERKKEVIIMINVNKKAGQIVKVALKGVLVTSANSTSSMIMHQPKAPARLQEFKRK